VAASYGGCGRGGTVGLRVGPFFLAMRAGLGAGFAGTPFCGQRRTAASRSPGPAPDIAPKGRRL